MRMRLVRFRHVPHGRVEKFERASPHDHPVIAPLSLSLGDCGFGAGWLRSFCVRPQACTRARPGVSIVRMCPVNAAVASILEVAMASLPVSDSRERPKQRDAIRDAIFGKNFLTAFGSPTSCFRHCLRGCNALFPETASALRRATPHHQTYGSEQIRRISPPGNVLLERKHPRTILDGGVCYVHKGTHRPCTGCFFIVTCGSTYSRCNARLESVVTCRFQVRRSRLCPRTCNMVACMRAPSHLGTARALLPCAKACSGYEQLFLSGRCQQRVRVTQQQHAPKSTAAHHAPRCMPRP